MIGKNMANAIDSTASACAFTMYEREPDRLEQIRGVGVDPECVRYGANCLIALLNHRSDCGVLVPRNARYHSLIMLAGWRTRVQAEVIGMPPDRFLAPWAQIWE